jgi:hypothetical protein
MLRKAAEVMKAPGYWKSRYVTSTDPAESR